MCKGCLNSDGLKGFNWSHIGYNTNGYEFQEEKKKTVDDCAAACRNENTCVGFTYVFKGHVVGLCAFYKNRNDFESTAIGDKEAKSYIRCSGLILYLVFIVHGKGIYVFLKLCLI